MHPELIILIHGLGRTRASMVPIHIAARRQGYRVINWKYASRRRTIEQHAEALARDLDEAVTGNATRVHFITHSLGGIIVRALLAKRDLPNLGRVVMLAPPNHGSEVADLLHNCSLFRAFTGRPGQELGTRSMSGAGALPPSCEVGIIAGSRGSVFSRWIAGENDGKVSVRNARLDGASDFAVVRRTHTTIPCTPEVIRMAMRFVRSGSFATPRTESR
jgi:triacylglycerol lipase